MSVPRAVQDAYVRVAERMHGSAGEDIGDDVTTPDSGVVIGSFDRTDVWRVKDAWGEYYVTAAGEYVCSKMADIMAVDVAEKFRSKIDYKELGMGDVAWDRAVIDALGGTMAEPTKKWSAAYVNDLPDVSFAYVEPGGRVDDVGKTAPRILRHFPYKDAEGNVDADQIQRVAARVDGANLTATVKTRVTAALKAVAVEKGVVLKVWSDEARAAAAEARRNMGVKPAGGRAADGRTMPDDKDDERDSNFDPDVPAPSEADEAARRARGRARKKSEFEETFKAEHPGSRVQTLVFDKAKYPKADDARGWASDHGFTSEKVDEGSNSIRVPQEDPKGFARMRTIDLTEGVRAVVGFSKKSVEAIQEVFFRACDARGTTFKTEELAAAQVTPVEESSLGTVYRVACGEVSMHVAETGGVAVQLPLYAQLQKFVPVMKSAEEQRYTLGVCYPASTKDRIENDFHGDVMSETELEKSAWGYMTKEGGGKVGLMHKPNTAGAGRVVESYVWRGPQWKMTDAHGADQTVDPGDWLLGVVWSPEAWAAVKSGNLRGFSLQGAARKALFETE